MKHQDAPGTTFKRHLSIAKGVLSEDRALLREILFNPHTSAQVSQIRTQLKELIDIIDHKDSPALNAYIDRSKDNVK